MRPHPADPLGVRAQLLGGQDGPIEIDFGDGSQRVKVKHSARPDRLDTPVQHSYQQEGCYMVTVLHGKTGEAIARQQLVVRGSTSVLGVSVSDDGTGARVQFHPTDDGTGVLPFVRIEWPGAAAEDMWAVPGMSARLDLPAGEHAVRVSDTTSGRASTFGVVVDPVPQHDPDFTVSRDAADGSGMTVVVRLEHVQPDRTVYVWWDDTDGPQVVETPRVGMEIPHTYAHPGHYMQTVTYAGAGVGRGKSESIVVPEPAAPEAWPSRGEARLSGQLGSEPAEEQAGGEHPGGGDDADGEGGGSVVADADHPADLEPSPVVERGDAQ